MGRGEGSRLRGPGQALEQGDSVAWGRGGQGWEAILCLGEMEILADSTLACVMDFF